MRAREKLPSVAISVHAVLPRFMLSQGHVGHPHIPKSIGRSRYAHSTPRHCVSAVLVLGGRARFPATFRPCPSIRK